MLGKFLTLQRAGRDENFPTDGHIFRSQNHSSHPLEGSAYGSTVKQATAVVKIQRARICDEAEQHLQKVISLYDIGVSLDILVADERLRNSLVNALESFNTQRSVESHWVASLTP
jgi:hypothetical protein